MTGEKGKKKVTCEFRYLGYKCDRPLYDDEHCIFHSEDIEGKREKFDEEFKKEFERQKTQEEKYDFNGFVFPNNISFEEIEFEKNVYFLEAQFSGVANFSKAKFKEVADFEDIKLEKCDSFEMIDTYFYNVSGLFESIEANKEKFKYSNKTEFLPDNFRLILGEEATARYPIFSRKIRDDMYLLKFKEKHPKLHFLWWLFADCGRSILRWALWSLGLSLFFGLLWLILGGNFFYFNPEKNITWLSYFYYSFVTFTTLGFGDIVPTNWISETLVTIEVILGYIMLGGLISILANKLARRS